MLTGAVEQLPRYPLLLRPFPLPSTKRAGKVACLPNFPHCRAAVRQGSGHRYRRGPRERLLFLHKRQNVVQRQCLPIPLLPSWKQPTVSQWEEMNTLSMRRENMSGIRSEGPALNCPSSEPSREDSKPPPGAEPQPSFSAAHTTCSLG